MVRSYIFSFLLIVFSGSLLSQVNCKTEITNLMKERASLTGKKRLTQTELKSGDYCSLCFRTATEIESDEKIPFQQHLQNVNGKAIPASSAAILEKANDYNDRLREINFRIYTLKKNCPEFSNDNNERGNPDFIPVDNSYSLKPIVENRYRVLADEKNQSNENNLETDDLSNKIRSDFNKGGSSKYFIKNESVVINNEIEQMLKKIIDSLNSKKLSYSIAITSGVRYASEQAEAMYNLTQTQRDKWYKGKLGDEIDESLYNELLNVIFEQDQKNYSDINQEKDKKKSIIEALTLTIEKQVKNDKYISSHLRGMAFDIGLNSSIGVEKQTLIDIIVNCGFKVKDETSDGHPCLHVSK